MANRGVQLKFGTIVVLVMTMPRTAGFGDTVAHTGSHGALGPVLDAVRAAGGRSMPRPAHGLCGIMHRGFCQPFTRYGSSPGAGGWWFTRREL
jgi:hypothetical protein